MGVDAVIRIQGKFTEGRLKQIFNELAHRFPNIVQHSFDEWKEHEGFYDLPTLARYYGPGYERGDALGIVGTLLWLLEQQDVEVVQYSGDCDITANSVTKEDVLALLQHYLSVGRQPYCGIAGTCPHCGYYTWCNGSMGGEKQYKCMSCEWDSWPADSPFKK